MIAETAANDGGWTVFCQAREDSDGDGQIAVRIGPRGELAGDRLVRYLAVGAGEGTPIDELAANDPTGRWLVVRREGKLELIDAHTGAAQELSAAGLDDRSDALPYRPHRTLSFDGLGQRLLTLRRDATGARAVVRDLASGSEAVIDPGPGEIWRMQLDFAGRWVVLSTLLDDTNRDGRLTWPAPERKAPPPCRGPVASYPAWVGRGDTPTSKVAPASGGTADAAPGLVLMLGEQRVVRDATGRLVLRAGTTETELASTKCGARVLHADAERKLLLVACAGPKGRPKLELVGPGLRVELGVDIAHASDDRAPGAPTRLVPVYPGNEAALLDLQARKLNKLTVGDVVLATAGARAVLRRGNKLVAYDAEMGHEEPLPGESPPLSHGFGQGSIAVAAPLVADAATGKLLGRVAGRPLAAAPDGRILVASGGDADATTLAVGPLEWRAPAPPSDASP